MKAKLNLRMEQDAIELAKDFAERRGVSVSKLVEQFFLALGERSPEEAVPISPFVESLRGVLPQGDEEEYRQYLEEKNR